jgi:uncharacterized membrane protein
MNLRMVTETNLFHVGESCKTNNLKVAEGSCYSEGQIRNCHWHLGGVECVVAAEMSIVTIGPSYNYDNLPFRH